ncbi:MAG: OmpA family protein [Spirochaetes bacterium]|nr:OmpA family protein [Spirochaetota bacterium]
MIKYCLYLKFLIIFLISISAQSIQDFQYFYQDHEKFSLIIRGNYRQYFNQRYIGLQSKEIKSIFTVDQQKKLFYLNGKVYYLSKMIRDNRNIGFEIQNIENCSFSINSSGHYQQISQHFYPIFRWIPFFPNEKLEIDKVYEMPGKAVVDLFEAKEQEIMPVHYMLVYKGKRDYKQKQLDYFEITCRFDSYHKSQKIIEIKGFHQFKLFYDNDNGRPVFMTDQFEEYIVNGNNNTEIKKGFYTFFFKDIVKMNKQKQLKEIEEYFDSDDLEKDIEIKETEEGISLTIQNLLFQPNSTQLLNGEIQKIEKIADILKQIEDRSFMIIGHTAKAGSEAEQLELSKARAAKIAQLLITAGVSKDKIMHTGKGANQPLAPNDTPENMKKNRRVEIFILEG